MSNAGFASATTTLSNILGGISIVGATLVLITFSLFSGLRTFPMTLVMALCSTIALSDFLFLLDNAGAFKTSTSSCSTMAGILHYLFLAQFCWNLVICCNFYLMLIQRMRGTDLTKYRLVYHAFAWCAPLLPVIVTGATDSYGDVGYGFCWIRKPVAQLVAFDLIVLIILTINGCVFVKLFDEISQTVSSSASDSVHRDRKKELRIYISIATTFGLGWVFGFLAVLFPPQAHIYELLTLLFVILTASQGLLIFGIYCANSKVWSYYRELHRIVKEKGLEGLKDYNRSINFTAVGGTSAATTASVGASTRSGGVSGSASRQYETE